MCRENPWLIEVDDTYRGLQYCVVFNMDEGYRCGYAEIPEGHRLYNVNFCENDIEQLSFCTFSGHIKGHNGFFFGWDHHHLCDNIDILTFEQVNKNLSEDEYIELLNHAREMAGNLEGSYSTKEDVVHECFEVIDIILNCKK